MTRGTRRRLICLGLIAMGLAISSYLLIRYFALHANPEIRGTGFCSAVLKMDCDASLLSDMSRRFGVPVAGWGVVYFVSLASLLILGHILGPAFDPQAALGALILSLAGACGSAVLAFAIVTRAAPFCPLCMVIHAINLGLVFAIWRFSSLTAGRAIPALAAAGKYLLGWSAESGSRPKWTCVGFLTTVLIAVVLYQCLLFQMQVRIVPQEAFDAKQVLVDYAFAPQEQIPFDSNDPQIGEGPVELVMFSSFECPACRIVSDYLQEATVRYKGKLKIIYKHFPLGTACNPRVEQDQYPHACAAALAAEAAKHYNAFWPFHDALLATDLSEPNDPVGRVVRETGLKPARFDELRNARITKEKLREDIELGSRLGVAGTPTIFINGRRLKHYSLQAIDLTIAAVANVPQIELAHLDDSRIRSVAISD